MSVPRQRESAALRLCCAGCFQEPGKFHHSDCPNRPERWAYVPIIAGECIVMRLVPEYQP